MNETHNTLPTFSILHGEVQITFPGSISYSMTAEAASFASDQLLAIACQALGQRLQAEQVAEHERAKHLG